MSAVGWAWEQVVSELAYRVLLPVSARLPLAWGAALARVRGRCDAAHDRDWRSLSLHHPYVRQATRAAIAELCPGLTDHEREALVRERFEVAALEEWQAHLIRAGRAPTLDLRFEGMTRTALAQRSAGPGTVWLTAHFDSVMLGIVHLGLTGVRFNLMTSTVVEDPRVPASIRRYYRHKYRAMARAFNGGRALQAELHLKALYAGLRQGEDTVILGDAPAPRGEAGLVLPFLGARRALAPGALRLAQWAGSPMGAFVCVRETPGCYRMVIHPPRRPRAGESYEVVAREAYGFLSEQMLQRPGRWWAADLLPTLPPVEG